MLKSKFSFIYLGLALTILSCNKGEFSYETTDTGLKYHFFKQNEGTKAKVGDFMTVNFIYKAKKAGVEGDTVLRNTWKDGQPINVVVQESSFKGGLEEGLQLLTIGDSVALQVNADSLFKKTFMTNRPSFIDSGSYITFIMKVEKIQNKEAFEKDQAKAMEERKAKMESEMANQKTIDDQLIKDYVAKNNIPAQSTPSGLYYVITKKGKGATAKAGQKVVVNYTGKLLDGTVFDSSVGKDPFEFTLGAGMVIPGWDEAIALLNPGSTATLILPSGLAYGPMQMGDKIPGNSTLVFDVELVSIKK